MLTRTVFVVAGLLAFPMAAAAETWKNVPVIDTLCISKVKVNLNKHTTLSASWLRRGFKAHEGGRDDRGRS